MKLTTMEHTVLSALFDSSKGNGHDFGFVEECRSAVERPTQLAGVMASLVKKGIITIHEAVVTNQGTAYQQRWTQTTWNLPVNEVAALITVDDANGLDDALAMRDRHWQGVCNNEVAKVVGKTRHLMGSEITEALLALDRPKPNVALALRRLKRMTEILAAMEVR